jgi:cytochrome c
MRHSVIAIATGLAALLFQTAGYAEVDAKWAQSEAKEHGCLVCHDIDKKKVGPAYKVISAKFKGKTSQDAVSGMKTFPVHKGALAKISDQDLKLIAEWILSL